MDDEPAIRGLLSLVFTQAGFTVAVSSSAKRAIALLADYPADVVLSDVNMRGMDGHELARWIHAHKPEVGVVLMTGFALDCGDCPIAGHCKTLRKPFAPEQAVRFINAALGDRTLP